MILVLDAGSPKTRFIEECVDTVCDVRRIPYLDVCAADFSDFKGIIISGASILVTEVHLAKYLDIMHLVIDSGLPVLGISFGHQILGLHFGAEASKIKSINDLQIVEAFEDCILFHRLPQEVQMMEDHSETISIPPGFKLIASSDACVNEVMQHLTLPYFGVQFHPEVSGNHGAIMIENFVEAALSGRFKIEK